MNSIATGPRRLKTCLNCGKLFDAIKPSRKFCSLACSSQMRPRKGTYICCEECGKEFYVCQSLHRRFCSTKCSQANRCHQKYVIKCQQCGKEFSALPCKHRKFCSWACARQARRRRITLVCANCGKVFQRSPSLVKKARFRYCNIKCMREHYRGGIHPMWAGDSTNEKGYIRVYCKGHPRGDGRGRVFEHIVVWERANNKSLPDGWVIHHLNGIPHDNRVENLVALPSKKHIYVLAAKAKRIQELEGKLRQQGLLI